MRNNDCGGLVYTMVLIFAVFLVCIAWSGHATTVNSIPLGERKITLKFCTFNLCDGFKACYCCQNEKPEPLCYKTREECKAVCPTCNPTCPPSSSSLPLVAK